MNITWPNFNRNQLILIVSGGIVLLLLLFALLRNSDNTVTLEEATKLIENNQIEKAFSDNGYTYFATKNEGVVKISSSQLPPELTANLVIEPKSGNGWIWFFLFFAVIGGAGYWAWKNRLGFEDDSPLEAPIVKAAAAAEPEVPSTNVTPAKSTVRFSDIGGIGDVKEELEEIIDFLRNPKRYYSFGARMPRGVLLVGPPGVGKTMIAKAVAAEADVPFFYQSGASFVQIYVGMGAKRVSELFSAAKKNAPAIIFIDEIDAVGKKREGGRNDEREGTLNQLLTEMDGFEETSGIVVIAATNNIDVMDAALLRAGRFDRRIFVELPTASEREAILQKYLRHIPHDLSVSDVAKMTVGFNGASLAALVNEAALLCMRQKEIQVKQEHFLAVKDKVMFGKKKIAMLSDEQRRYQVRYQAGKVFAATWFDLPYEKITLTNDAITPPTAEPQLRHEIEAHVRVHLAGIASSHLRFGEHASNASHDLSVAKDLVHAMIYEYGMGSSVLPSEEDEAKLMDRLYTEMSTLLERNEKILSKFEAILDEYEHISKALARATMHEIL
ncbi:AAA ATPase central domain protein [Sulfuricurvum kujiense DSM 16994]|uniref:AAA ATPase central domain protein n=1 Tax=Sulfuricurvum kujiense (strain ATCC BAA-921 / DSM 16994 / JCM 11577 / YK-1) TaxID=709032 RepID=E4U306_SULKY|nr:ATP-dependent metallopeptidase FtsH/Yme1/Tma family protein [Sulfuricurvum kujiense]ADR33676.1 AAA ATPase central domain protein [Sulfuricurvum kujiense DSM 16994]